MRKWDGESQLTLQSLNIYTPTLLLPYPQHLHAITLSPRIVVTRSLEALGEWQTQYRILTASKLSSGVNLDRATHLELQRRVRGTKD